MPDLSLRLEACYVSAAHDVMRAMGLADFVLPAALRPILPEQRLAGPAFTVGGRRVEGADAHATLLAWTGVLSKTPPGTVLVCQPNDRELALMGELSAEALRRKGVRGYIVDGGCRDVDFLLAMRFQVFCRFFTPADVVGRWLPDGLGEPILIGGVAIATGDYVFGDRDGIIVIAAARAAEIVERTERVIATESDMRKAIQAGMDAEAAYLKYGKF